MIHKNHRGRIVVFMFLGMNVLQEDFTKKEHISLLSFAETVAAQLKRWSQIITNLTNSSYWSLLTGEIGEHITSLRQVYILKKV